MPMKFILQVTRQATMKLLLTAAILCAAILAVQCASETDYDSYKGKFGKNYKDSSEHEQRFSHFNDTDNDINDHNARYASGLETYTKGHNDFSDWTDAEKQRLLGYKPSGSRSLPVSVDESLLDRALPASYDLRTSKCLPAIKNQGNCGDCYAFASVTPIEYQFCLKKNNNVSVTLSEQQVTDCTYTAAYNGCNGGTHEDVFGYIARAGGLATSAAYPFTSGITGVDGTCKSGVTKLAKIASTFTVLPANEPVVQSALVTYGPITTAFYVTNNFFYYKSGVFSDTTCTSDPRLLNHEVVIVGYGTTTTGTPYWIVRNQWGTSWGQSGYVSVKRGVNMCGIVSDIGYPTVI